MAASRFRPLTFADDDRLPGLNGIVATCRRIATAVYDGLRKDGAVRLFSFSRLRFSASKRGRSEAGFACSVDGTKRQSHHHPRKAARATIARESKAHVLRRQKTKACG